MWLTKKDFIKGTYVAGQLEKTTWDKPVKLEVIESNLKSYPVGKIIEMQEEYIIDGNYKVYYFHDGSHRTVFWDHFVGLMIDTKVSNYVKFMRAD